MPDKAVVQAVETGADAATEADSAAAPTPTPTPSPAAGSPIAPAHSAASPIDVAVGILMKPNGDVLLGQRPAGKPYADYWEFPGGKVESGESIFDALKRELKEELGLEVLSAEPWCGVEHVYPHAHVRLHFYISRDWRGEPASLEGQAFAWQGSVSVEPLLPATIPLIEWLDRLRYPAQ